MVAKLAGAEDAADAAEAARSSSNSSTSSTSEHVLTRVRGFYRQPSACWATSTGVLRQFFYSSPMGKTVEALCDAGCTIRIQGERNTPGASFLAFKQRGASRSQGPCGGWHHQLVDTRKKQHLIRTPNDRVHSNRWRPESCCVDSSRTVDR